MRTAPCEYPGCDKEGRVRPFKCIHETPVYCPEHLRTHAGSGRTARREEESS